MVEQKKPQPIMVRSIPIELSQFLKVANVVMSGGEAKSLVQSGEVRVNNQLETRRSHRLQAGDVVEIAGELQFEVVLGER